VWMRAAAGKLPLPSSVHPDLAPYDAIVARGMARDTTERYDSARQMALDLERCAGTSSQAELSAWLESVIAPVLDQRSQMVSSIESFSGVSVSDVREMIESDLSVTSDVTSPHSAAAALSTRIQVPRPHSSHPPPAGDGTGVPVAVPSAAALPRFDEKRSSPSLLVLAVVLPLVLVGAAAAALWWPGGSMGPGEVVEDDGARDSPASPLPSARSDSTDQTSDPVVGSSVAGADPSVASSVSATASALDSAESTATAPTPVVPLAPNTSGAPSAPAPSASSKGAFDELGGRL